MSRLAELPVILAALAAFACAGCGDAPAEPALPFAHALPIRFEMDQRSTLEIPETAGALRVSLGDITDGQVHTSVTGTAPRSAQVLGVQSLREGEVLAFAWLEVPLQLVLVELDTSLLGTDAARFVLEPGGTSVEQAHARVDALLLDLAEQEGVTFVRNGSDHSAEEAAAHLRRKFDHARDEIRSVDDFIRLCGTQSSMSGEPYLVRASDGTERPAADFLHELARRTEPGAHAR